jgi:hypothetical protein
MRARPSLLLVPLLLLLPACDRGSEGSAAPTSAPVPTVRESPAPVDDGEGSASAVMAELCDHGPPPGSEPVPPEGPTPPAIEEVQLGIEELRGLTFTEPVVAEPADEAELVEGLEESFDYMFPRDLLARRSLAWQTIGVIPPGTNVRDELEAYASGEVIGYYDTLTGELVFIGTDDPTPIEEVTLAHELTHAIDDQNFGLERLDSLLVSCRDEAATAATALVEGNATFFMTAYALRYLTSEEQLQLATEGGESSTRVAPFIERQQVWPYFEGQAFVSALSARGGVEAIDEAFLDLPVSTEQILHPERYPNDVPTPVDVPDLGPALGAGWEDLDVQEVGEAWLSLALALRLDRADAADAAAGWDGGLYRAWASGDRVAVVLSTVWDTAEDAREFADVMARWIAASPNDQAARVLPVQGERVQVHLANDGATLAMLGSAAEVPSGA